MKLLFQSRNENALLFIFYLIACIRFPVIKFIPSSSEFFRFKSQTGEKGDVRAIFSAVQSQTDDSRTNIYSNYFERLHNER